MDKKNIIEKTENNHLQISYPETKLYKILQF